MKAAVSREIRRQILYAEAGPPVPNLSDNCTLATTEW